MVVGYNFNLSQINIFFVAHFDKLMIQWLQFDFAKTLNTAMSLTHTHTEYVCNRPDRNIRDKNTLHTHFGIDFTECVAHNANFKAF